MIDFAEIVFATRFYKKIFIYGIGNEAAFAKKGITEYGASIAGFIMHGYEHITVHRELSQDKFYQIKDVFPLLQRQDCFVLLVDDDNEIRRAEGNLIRYGVANYKNISDYDDSSRFFHDMLNKRSQAEWKEFLKYFLTRRFSISHRKIELLLNTQTDIVENDVLRRVFYLNKKRNCVLFIVSGISQRVYKLAKVIKKRGIKIFCIFLQPREESNSIQVEISTVVDKIFICKTIIEITYYILTLQVSYIHIFAQPYMGIYDMLLIYKLLLMKKFFPPIVYEEYDVAANDMRMPSLLLDLEKKCIKYASIIVDRSYEVEALINKFNYYFKGKYIRLFDGCLGDYTPSLIIKDDSRPLSLCYAGSIFSERECPNDPSACWLELAQDCEQNKCHLHIYPAIQHWLTKKDLFSDYFALDKESYYFHFHEPVPYSRLAYTLSKYDYGITASKKVLDNFNQFNKIFTREKYLYCSINKLFDYIEAGIPIVGFPMAKIVNDLVRKGVAISAFVGEYDFSFLLENRNKYRTRVLQMRDEFMLDNNINSIFKEVNITL